VNLQELLGDVLEVDPSVLDDDAGQSNTDGWDSLAHVSIIAAIEETYGVEFSAAEMRDASSVGTLRAVLAAKGVRA
jgi:acyl carrier protein